MEARVVRVELPPAPTPASYDVRVGPGTLLEVEPLTRSASARAIVTDANVERLYRAKLDPTGSIPCFALPAGEHAKSFRELERVLDFFVDAGLDRRSLVLALGGGVVGDLAGLAAALHMRGIAVAQVPTTLLAQVDSSVGGKTAVNLRGGKNLAGAFHQPSVVFADTSTLATLTGEELRSGLGEVLKTALLDGEEALLALERDAQSILARDAETLAKLVARCVALKAAIVARDPHEKHDRKALNLGHTFAHAIEHAAGYGTIPHGVAVGVGVAMALRASEELGVAASSGLCERVESLLRTWSMPASLAELRTRVAMPPDALVAGLKHDKKGAAGLPRFVLLERPGAWRLDVAVEPSRVEAWFAA